MHVFEKNKNYLIVGIRSSFRNGFCRKTCAEKGFAENFHQGIWNCLGWIPPLLVSCAWPEIVGGFCMLDQCSGTVFPAASILLHRLVAGGACCLHRILQPVATGSWHVLAAA